MMYRCMNQAASSVGIMAIAAPAAMGPYWTSMEPQNDEIKTLTVLASRRVNKNA